MKRVALTALLASVFCMAGLADAVARQRPLVFVIHGGGYVFGGDSPTHDPATSLEDAQVAQFRRHGIDAVSVPYQRGDPGRATAQVESFVRGRSRGRRAYAMGASAGGGLALSLANQGLVRAVAAMSPLSDVRGWVPGQGFGWSQASMAQASPVLGHRRAPMFLEHAVGDPVVPYAQSQRFVRSHPWAQLQTDQGDQHGPAGQLWGPGFDWLVKQIRSRR